MKTGLTYHAAWQRQDNNIGHARGRVWGHDQPIRLQAEGEVTEAYDFLGKPVELNSQSGGTVITLKHGAPVFVISPTRLSITDE